MKRSKYIITGLLAIAIVSVGITKYGIAAGSEPGSSTDPVVSKSYVDGQINEIKNLINKATSGNNNSSNENISKDQVVSEVLAVIDTLYGDKLGEDSNTEKTAFTPVQLRKGQYILGGEGAELIFRSGKASAYSENTMGVVDLSTGKELLLGVELSVNHLLMVSRNDGRGVYAKEDSWFMVKGEYSIK